MPSEFDFGTPGQIDLGRHNRALRMGWPFVIGVSCAGVLALVAVTSVVSGLVVYFAMHTPDEHKAVAAAPPPANRKREEKKQEPEPLPIVRNKEGHEPSSKEPPANAPAAEPVPPPVATDAWKRDADAELKEALSRTRKPEPAKAPLMTEVEYTRARIIADSTLSIYPIDAPFANADAVSFLLDGERRSRVSQVMPVSLAALEREALLQAAGLSSEEIERRINMGAQPMRRLLDPTFKKSLLARLPWRQRKEAYGDFAEITEDQRPWSLIHPFDDLDRDEMRNAVAVAAHVKRSGLGSVDRTERRLLLKAGAMAFFRTQLTTGK